MPLHHIGAIACNLIAPLLARSRIVFKSAFTPASWLQRVQLSEAGTLSVLFRPAITWCYQVGPMWSLLVRHLTEKCLSIPRHHLRVLRSGAAPLPHSHAEALANLFGCCVLPTYSMTECMPIAAPPLSYRLERPGSVGLPIGVQLTILDPLSKCTKQMRDTGEIAISAVDNKSQLFAGYGHKQCAAFGKALFSTGDLGYIDEEGWLFITGRIREMINRGGEVVSPVEIEDTLAGSAAGLQELMAFAVAHDALHEVVGVAVTHKCPLDLAGMRELVRVRLGTPQMPQLLLRVDQLPRTASGKLQRAGFAHACGLPTLSGTMRRSFQLDTTEGLNRPRLHELASTEATVAIGSGLKYSESRSAASVISKEEDTCLKAALQCGASVIIAEEDAETIDTQSLASKSATPVITDEKCANASAAGVEASQVLQLARTMVFDNEVVATLDIDTLLVDVLDSLAIIELAEQLRNASSQKLPITIVYDEVTARRISTYLAGMDRSQPRTR